MRQGNFLRETMREDGFLDKGGTGGEGPGNGFESSS